MCKEFAAAPCNTFELRERAPRVEHDGRHRERRAAELLPFVPASPSTKSTGIFCSAGGSPAEVSWELSCSDGTSLSGGAPSAAAPVEVALGATCTLAMADAGGDGWDGAEWAAPGLGQRFSLASGFDGRDSTGRIVAIGNGNHHFVRHVAIAE